MPNPLRRHLLLAAGASLVGFPALADGVRLPRMTEGPFYPPASWRTRRSDWDADLTAVSEAGSRRARGEHLALELVVADARGRTIDGAEVEIWQCDAFGAYRHPHVDAVPGRFDEAFQGFGEARTGSDGTGRFRTIRPTPYPGRTPHIHLRLRHPGFGELTSQLFVDGDAGNERDFLWRRLSAAERVALAMKLEPATDAGLRWRARHLVVVGT